MTKVGTGYDGDSSIIRLLQRSLIGSAMVLNGAALEFNGQNCSGQTR